jgi:hypothetical protein
VFAHSARRVLAAGRGAGSDGGAKGSGEGEEAPDAAVEEALRALAVNREALLQSEAALHIATKAGKGGDADADGGGGADGGGDGGSSSDEDAGSANGGNGIGSKSDRRRGNGSQGGSEGEEDDCAGGGGNCNGGTHDARSAAGGKGTPCPAHELSQHLPLACRGLVDWRRTYGKAQTVHAALAFRRERASRKRDPAPGARHVRAEALPTKRRLDQLLAQRGDWERMARLQPQVSAVLAAPDPRLPLEAAAAGAERGGPGAAARSQEAGVAGCARGCPWCEEEAHANRAWERRQQKHVSLLQDLERQFGGGSNSSSGGGGGTSRFASAYGSWPVDPSSPFMWRRLWWGLLGRLAPRARDLLASQAGMCPHSSDRELWAAVFSAVGTSLPFRDPRVAAMAGLQQERTALELAVAAAAAATYAKQLNNTFDAVRLRGAARVAWGVRAGWIGPVTDRGGVECLRTNGWGCATSWQINCPPQLARLLLTSTCRSP